MEKSIVADIVNGLLNESEMGSERGFRSEAKREMNVRKIREEIRKLLNKKPFHVEYSLFTKHF